MPLVEQELPTFPEHLNSPPVFSGVRFTRSSVFVSCFIHRCLSFCIFLLAIALSALFQYTDSDYPFGIVKLFYFLSWSQEKNGACNKFLFQGAHFTIQENAINCKRQEVNDKILSIKVQMYSIYNFSMNFHKVILEKEAIDS